MLVQDLGNPFPITSFEISKQQALVGGDPHAGLEFGENLPQSRLQLKAITVDDPAILNIKAIEEFSVTLFEPADVVVKAMHIGLVTGSQRLAEVFLDLGPEGLKPHVVDGVFQPGHLAV